MYILVNKLIDVRPVGVTRGVKKEGHEFGFQVCTEQVQGDFACDLNLSQQPVS